MSVEISYGKVSFCQSKSYRDSMKIAVAIIHGMGSQTHGFSNPLQRGIAKQYQSLGHDYRWDDLIFKEIIWSDLLASRQKQLFERVNYRQDLNYMMPRKYLIDYLSDVVAYQSVYDEMDGALPLREQIHQRVEQGLLHFQISQELLRLLIFLVSLLYLDSLQILIEQDLLHSLI